MHPRDAEFNAYSLYHSLHTEEKGSCYGNPTFLHNGILHENVDGKYGEELSVDFILDFMKGHAEEPLFVYYPREPKPGKIPPSDRKRALSISQTWITWWVG